MNYYGIITNYDSLICTWNYYECGTFELTINKNKANTNKLKKGNMIIVDKKDDKILLIDKVVITTNKNSKRNLYKRNNKTKNYSYKWI